MTATPGPAARCRPARAEGERAGPASAASRLGKHADIRSGGRWERLSTAERAADRRARRGEGLVWRTRLWSWTSLPRLRNCGRVTHIGVGAPIIRVLGDGDDRRAGLAGLQSCGSPWSCPVCARRISAQRSTEVRHVLQAAAATGGSAALVTLTMRHHSGQRLADLWEALSAAWRAVTSGRAWTKEQASWGVLGWVRTVEATHGEHGWHLHVHAVVVFDGPVSLELAAELGGRMFGRWQRALGRRGLSAVEDRGGLDVREVRMVGDSIERVAEYLSKITSEITSPSTKDGRYGNRSPFAILRDALTTGLADDCELWLQWEQASHGRKQLTWSRDLREWAGLHVERSDEDIVAEDLRGDDVLAIAPESWPAVRLHVADLLDTVELGGLPAAQRWLTSRGLRWSLPSQRRGIDP